MTASEGVDASEYAEAGATWVVESIWPHPNGWYEERRQAPRPGRRGEPAHDGVGVRGDGPEGIDSGERVGKWLVDNVEGAEPPFTYDLIGAGGHSNLTFRFTDANGTPRVPQYGRLSATCWRLRTTWAASNPHHRGALGRPTCLSRPVRLV